jgi:hypothetical protein
MPRKKVEGPGKPRGRPRKSYEFHEARELVRSEGIKSIGQYKRWWMLNTPARIPKRPDRAYKKEWQGWGDFLGHHNEYPFIKKSYRSFDEAKKYAHSLGLVTKADWVAFAKTDEKPEDIPSRPDLIYRDEWFTWKDWLGADIASVKRNIDKADAIFFIIQNPGRPHNVFQTGITAQGIQTILDHEQKRGFRIVGLFYSSIEFNWEYFADAHGRVYWESGLDNEYLINNINEFIFQISEFVERVRN